MNSAMLRAAQWEIENCKIVLGNQGANKEELNKDSNNRNQFKWEIQLIITYFSFDYSMFELSKYDSI